MSRLPELSGRELLGEWRKLMDSVVSSAGAVGDRAPALRQLLEPMQRQLELVQEVIERERKLQRDLAGHLLAPIEAIFDLLEDTGGMLSRQAEALQAAGRALEETAGLMRTQAEMFERTVGALRQPADLARSAAGLERRKRATSSASAQRKRASSPKPKRPAR